MKWSVASEETLPGSITCVAEALCAVLTRDGAVTLWFEDDDGSFAHRLDSLDDLIDLLVDWREEARRHFYPEPPSTLPEVRARAGERVRVSLLADTHVVQLEDGTGDVVWLLPAQAQRLATWLEKHEDAIAAWKEQEV